MLRSFERSIHSVYRLDGIGDDAFSAEAGQVGTGRKRSGNQRDHVKTSQQSKQRHKSERHVSERAKQQAANTFTRALPTARDKDVPDATFEKKAVGEKGVLTPGPDVEDWQKALYQEFLVWRTKQMMFGNGD
jgi:hypothetical protein